MKPRRLCLAYARSGDRPFAGALARKNPAGPRSKKGGAYGA
jgi:hypothetical protein